MADNTQNALSVPLRADWNDRHGYGSIAPASDSSSFSGRDLSDSGPASAASEVEQQQQHHDRSVLRFRYWAYYLPFLNWIPQYRWRWLRDDFIAALTVASLYIPMCFSFSLLGGVDPVSGLYAFIIHPIFYALLGSCPQMVVGPEATGSLLIGALNRQIQRSMQGDGRGSDDLNANIEVSGVTTAIAGAMLLVAGFVRIGFVDSMLSRPFMQGFICAVGFVLVVEQAIPELGLADLSKEVGLAKSSSAISKVIFLLTHLSHTHRLTAAISLSSLAFILIFRVVQKKVSPRYPFIALVPDRLFVVAVTAIITWQLRLDQRGIEVLGALGTKGAKLPSFHWPLSNMALLDQVFGTAFLAALLGFFESTVTAKSLRPTVAPPRRKTLADAAPLSANRELIALGTANLVGGFFTTLPAFGGFGRSKLNAQAGGHTPMSSILLAVITLLCVFFILPGLYYVPKPVLSAMASAVGVSMMEECPHDIRFFFRVRGWRELFLMAVVFLATVCYSMSLGISVGIVLTLFSLVRHSTRSRIQILGRTPGSKHAFEDAEFAPDADQVDRCLVVRIPEPLTFANIGDLRARLRRLERTGNGGAHPSRPRTRALDRAVVFDVHGLTALDACAAQILADLVRDYVRQGVAVVFCRVRPERVRATFRRSGITDLCGGPESFVDSVGDALRLAGVPS